MSTDDSAAPETAPRIGGIPPLIAVVAMTEERVIGRDGELPWHLPGDLRWFKKLTTPGTLIMGRKTFDSIGRALPGRRNVVLTRSPGTITAEGIEVVASPDGLAEIGLEAPAYVIGGSEIYRLLFPSCDEVYLTRVFENYPGDTFLPPFEADFDEGEVVHEGEGFDVVHYRRKTPAP